MQPDRTTVNADMRELEDVLQRAKYKVYTILRHVADSGMSRQISVIAIIDNEPLNISYKVGVVLDRKLDIKNQYAIA